MNANERMKEFRLHLKLSQSDFGKVIGLEQGSVSDLERGRANVSDTIQKLLAQKYGVRKNWLTGNDNIMFEASKPAITDTTLSSTVPVADPNDRNALLEENRLLKEELLELNREYRKLIKESK